MKRGNFLKQLIINADDFGLTEGINRGIIQAYNNGILTSASLMANMPAFENAVFLLRESPNLGVGAHLNIVRGKPILPKKTISSLVESEGNFYSFFQVLKRLLLSRFNFDEIESEFRAQIKKILSYGVCITHLDTEKHLHFFPSILKILLKLAKEFRINKIRSFKQDSRFAMSSPYGVFNSN